MKTLSKFLDGMKGLHQNNNNNNNIQYKQYNVYIYIYIYIYTYIYIYIYIYIIRYTIKDTQLVSSVSGEDNVTSREKKKKDSHATPDAR